MRFLKSIPPDILLSLLALYFIWGSTYLAIRFALESFPPFLMAALRFFTAGGLMMLFLRLRGHAFPTPLQWRNGAIVGILLLVGGNGGVVYAEQTVSSSLSAALIATTPIWASLFSMIWGHRNTRIEWIGVGIGFIGIMLLNMQGELSGNPIGVLALFIASTTWAFGSVWSQKLDMPKGAMGIAVEMFAASPVLFVISALGQEQLRTFTVQGVGSLIYLIIFGSWIAFSAYMYLLNKVRPALATSYAYVNPLVALGLGMWLAGESVTLLSFIGIIVTLVGVAFIVLGKGLATPRTTPPIAPESAEKLG